MTCMIRYCWVRVAVVLLLALCGAVGLDAAPEPVAWYRFDERAGVVANDASGNGIAGRIEGRAFWDEGIHDGALRFDGNSYVEVPFDPRLQLGSALTIQFWFKPTDIQPNTFKHLVSLWDSYLVRLDNPAENNKLSFFVFLDGKPEPRISFGAPTVGEWHQVFAVWDGTNTVFWLDGVRRSARRTGSPNPKPNPLRLGENFIGLIDEVKIYNRALTDGEILDQIPSKLVSGLYVRPGLSEVGKPMEISCTVSNVGGQPLLNGSARVIIPMGMRLLGGTSTVQIPAVTRAAPFTVTWHLIGETRLADYVQSVVEFPGQAPVTNLAGVVVTRAVPSTGPAYTSPTIDQIGNNLILANRALRLVFPSNDFGYGVMALDMNRSNSWRRFAVANCLSQLAVRTLWGTTRQFINADRWEPVRTEPTHAGVRFHSRITDAIGVNWLGQFTFLIGDDDRVRVTYELVPDKDAELVLFQGPTLLVGEGSFGRQKDEALFGGVEWLVGNELSSSDTDMHDPEHYIRFIPHPNKITVPIMAVAKDGATVALYWDCLQRWDGAHDRPAAVFASPNFLDGQDNHLLGLFIPAVPDWTPPNHREATMPYKAAAGRPLRLEAWLTVISPANGVLDALPRWFDTFGVPDPAPLPRGSYLGEIEFSMRAFMLSLWDPMEQKWWTSKNGPPEMSYLSRPAHYLFQLRSAALLTTNQVLRDQFNARAELGERLAGSRPEWDDLGLTWADPVNHLRGLRANATAKVDQMGSDGAWRFRARIETDGIFAGRDYGLLGPDGAVEVGTCARNAYEILRYAHVSGDLEAFATAEKTLRLMERFTVPRAAQVWECPVHAPDILAAADAVDAYVEAWRFSRNRRYLDEAVRWAWAGLPFVYMWNPPSHPVLRYASIAILGGSWFEGSWIGQPVQWNGLRYAYALLKLAEHDSSFPWRRIAEGLTVSAMYQQETGGTNVALWPDNFSALNWSKCPWVFEPGMIVKNVLKLMGHDVEPTTVKTDLGIRLTSRASFEDVTVTNSMLRFVVRFPGAETSQVLLSSINRPAGIRVNGVFAPATTGSLWDVPGPAWRYDADLATVTVKLVSPGSNLVEVFDPVYQAVGWVFPLPETIEYNFNRSLEGWSPANQIQRLTVTEGQLQGVATGGDPYLHQTRLRLNGNACHRIVVRLRAQSGHGLALYWITTDDPYWSESKSIHLPFAGGIDWNEYNFEVGWHPQWSNRTIIGLRLDPLEGGPGGEFAIDFIRGDHARLHAVGLEDGVFRFRLEGCAEVPYVVDISDNLESWQQGFHIPGGAAVRELFDSNAGWFHQRFYRARPAGF